MANIIQDAYTRENTKGKVSMAGATNEIDAIIERETNMSELDKIIKRVTSQTAALNDQIEYLQNEGKLEFLESMEKDATYQARKEATEDFTIQWCTSLRQNDDNFIRTEMFGRRTLHAYKFNVNACTFSQLVSMWNSATNVVDELRKKKLEAAREAAQAKRKAEEEYKKGLEDTNKELAAQLAEMQAQLAALMAAQAAK